MGANHVWGERQRQRVANEGENPVPHYWDHVVWVFGMDDRDAFLDYADQITLNGQVEKIKVPFLITHGENDRQIPAFNAHLSYDQAVNSPKRTLRMFTKADFEVEHCGADNGTDGVMAEFTFHHGGGSVPSLAEAIDWYGRVLGFEVEKRFYIEAARSHTAMLRKGPLRFEIFE
ncbi:hypothetical protein KXV85_003281, partial [Aspergillus fumigatus]